MRLWRPRNGLRLAATVAIGGAIAAALVTGRPWLWSGVALSIYACFVVFELALRFRARSAQVPTDHLAVDGREHARRLDLPWRSSLAWDTYDLSVSDTPGSDWFSDWFKFEARPGDPIVIEAEAVVPGPGVEVRLFAPGDGVAPTATAKSDSCGRASVSLVTYFGGSHLLHVRIATHGYGMAQRYRLSVSGPSSTQKRTSLQDPASRFTDVALWHPYHDAIQSLTERRAMSGNTRTADPTFAPDLPVWVAEFDYALAQTIAPRSPNGGLSGARTPARTRTNGAGSPGGPDQTITRLGAIRAIVESADTASPGLLEGPPPDFTSAFEGGPYAQDPHLLTAEFNGLLSGIPRLGPSWDPEAPTTRGEAAQLIYAATHMIERPAPSGGRPSPAPDDNSVGAKESAPDPSWASDDDLVTGFVPGAHEALDDLMDDFLLTDIPADAASGQIDAAAMRATIETMRARFDAQRQEPPEDPEGAGEEPDTNGSESLGGSNDPGD